MVKNNTISAYYFPTTPFLVDDDPDFLKGCESYFPERPKPVTFTDPQKAIDFLTKHYHSILKVDYFKEIDHAEMTHEGSGFELDIFSLHQIIHSPDRFREVSVIFADYSMPRLSGVDLFKAIHSTYFKKVLLTGQATKNEGINAFNEKIIHHFLEKQSRLDHTVQNTFDLLEKDYFLTRSTDIMNRLMKNKNSSIGETEFVKLFNQILQTNNIVEYYLISQSGCFLMFDFSGKPSWLIVKSEDEMKYYRQSAEDNDAPSSIKKRLKDKRSILFLYSPEDDKAPYDQWEKYLHHASSFQGEKNKFYFSYLKNCEVYDRQLGNIISFKDYLSG